MEEYRQYLKNNLSPKRYRHSLAVAEQATWLAEEWSGNKAKAELAGLLHDICKEMPLHEQLQYLSSRDILISKFEQENPNIVHGLVGRIFLEENFDFTDKEILNAIEYHVIGKANMTLLEEIVFLADYTSADRTFLHCIEVRKLLPNHKEKAIHEILRYSMVQAMEQGNILEQEIVDTYNFYTQRI